MRITHSSVCRPVSCTFSNSQVSSLDAKIFFQLIGYDLPMASILIAFVAHQTNLKIGSQVFKLIHGFLSFVCCHNAREDGSKLVIIPNSRCLATLFWVTKLAKVKI